MSNDIAEKCIKMVYCAISFYTFLDNKREAIMSHTLKDKLFSNPFIIELMNNVSESIYIYDEKGYTVFINKAAE